MNSVDLLSQPLFWALVFVVASAMVVFYFILRQAIADGIRQAHEQEKRDEEGKRHRGGY